MSTLDDVKAAATARAAADTKYRAAILQAHKDGHSVRAIAEVAGVSHGTIHNMIIAAK
jgi:DNA-directed RNA polymerase specialized sigma24 family protein